MKKANWKNLFSGQTWNVASLSISHVKSLQDRTRLDEADSWFCHDYVRTRRSWVKVTYGRNIIYFRLFFNFNGVSGDQDKRPSKNKEAQQKVGSRKPSRCATGLFSVKVKNNYNYIKYNLFFISLSVKALSDVMRVRTLVSM